MSKAHTHLVSVRALLWGDDVCLPWSERFCRPSGKVHKPPRAPSLPIISFKTVEFATLKRQCIGQLLC